MFLNKHNIYGPKGNLVFDIITSQHTHTHTHTHTLLEITEKIKQSCDSVKYACEIFLDLQKASDTVNDDILLKKLCH